MSANMERATLRLRTLSNLYPHHFPFYAACIYIPRHRSSLAAYFTELTSTLNDRASGRGWPSTLDTKSDV